MGLKYIIFKNLSAVKKVKVIDLKILRIKFRHVRAIILILMTRRMLLGDPNWKWIFKSLSETLFRVLLLLELK